MAYNEMSALLGGWAGFELVQVEREPAQGDRAPQMTLTLRAVPGVPKHGGGCGAVVEAVHDTSERRVRDLPILDAETWLRLPRARLACPRCGPTVAVVEWLDRYRA